MKPDRPIFLIGTGRSGSTVFHRIFTHHERVNFLHEGSRRFPGSAGWHRWGLRLADGDPTGRVMARLLWPSECWEFWEHHIPGFSEVCRDLRADDVRPEQARRLVAAVGERLTRRRPRWLVKLTGWPRVGYLSQIFPDARFVHIVRDGRAVANSLLDVEFWRGWLGPRQWRWGDLSPEHAEEWERSDRSFVVLAAIHWKILMASYAETRNAVDPARYQEIRYEDLTADPIGVFQRALDFCELDFSPRFRRIIEGFGLRSANDKWRRHLTARQAELLETSLAEELPRWGYAPAGASTLAH